MSGHQPFDLLRESLLAKPGGIEAVERHRIRIDAIMTIADARRRAGIDEEEISRAWEVSQPNVSRVEHEQDLYLSTLSAYVDALGGHLELTAVFPDQNVKLDLPSTIA